MNHHSRTAALAAAVIILLASGLANAGDGHDHGEAPAATGDPALPRFAAESESFELVGVVDGRRLTLYLDRFGDGSPVGDARIELDLGGQRLLAEPQGDGSFAATLAQKPAPGMIPVTATITAGDESDLLAADLDIHDAAHAEAPAAAPSRAAIAAAGSAVLAAFAAAWVAARRRRALQTGGAA